MHIIDKISTFCILACLLQGPVTSAQNDTATATKSRLTVGGYGEAVYSHHFYSDNVFRYSHADRYKDAPGYGRVDLPHAVIMLGYDFGHGWSVGTEIEFEHGGIEAAVEKETEETGEFEQEVERGGEVALEQFWVQKSFNPHLNVRAGHIVVPVGMTNNGHTPNMFFGVYRPEGENTIMPCTWHETGLSLWGRAGAWRYEAQLLPGLNSNLFNDQGWVHNGSASPYEFRPANALACAARVDWTGIRGLRLSLSGYLGGSNNNDIVTDVNSRYKDLDGLVAIGCFDFAYRNRHVVVRGNVDYGHLSDAAAISARNKNQTTMTGNPYPHTFVGEAAWDASIEAGVDLLSFAQWRRSHGKLYLFARYDQYDSYVPAEGLTDIGWCSRQVVSGGVNYYPLPQVALKAEGGVRLLGEQYNNEPFFALGVTWTGFFVR